MKHKRNLKEFRERILELDGHTCRGCGWVGFLSAHHILYRSQGGDEASTNGVTLCMACDDKAHNGYTDIRGKRVPGRKFVYDVLLTHKGKDYDRWEVKRQELKLIVERKSHEI